MLRRLNSIQSNELKKEGRKTITVPNSYTSYSNTT